MPVSWRVEDDGLLVVEGSGAVTDEEYLGAHTGFIAATAGQTGPRRALADWSAVTLMKLTAAAIGQSAGRAQQTVRTTSAPSMITHRMALVATTPAIYGMCRMWQIQASQSGLVCQVFESRDAALAWLRS